MSDKPKILECDWCGKRTTEPETMSRIFRTGLCDHCGGKLYRPDKVPFPNRTMTRESH